MFWCACAGRCAYMSVMPCADVSAEQHMPCPHLSGAEQQLPSTCRMAALYSHMSEHVHEFEYNGKGSDAVIIWRELVNSGQAKALMCIAARVNIAVQRGQRRQRTPRGSS